MKRTVSYIIIFFSLSVFQSLFDGFQTEARPGGGGSYRGSSSSSSRSSSQSGSRSGSSSFGRSSSTGGRIATAVDDFFTFLFAFVFSCAGIIVLGIGLQALGKGEESAVPIPVGLVFSSVGAWLASLSSVLLYILLTVLFMMPLILIFLGIRKILWGREIIFTAKGKIRNEK